MGQYCCCGEKFTDDYSCKCDQTGWVDPEIELPEKDGFYEVRCCDPGNGNCQCIAEFSKDKKFKFQTMWCDPEPYAWGFDDLPTDKGVYQWKKA